MAAFDRHPAPAGREATARDVLAILERRPCTARDVAQGLSTDLSLAQKHLDALLEADRVTAETREDAVYYLPSR